MDHTKEPWNYVTIADTDEASIHPVCDDEWAIAICADGVMVEHSAESNARRIVACVNKCVGIETEDLENGATFTEQFYAIRNQREISEGELSSLRSALAEKTAQVEALKNIVESKSYRTIIMCKPAYVINYDDVIEALAATAPDITK